MKISAECIEKVTLSINEAPARMLKAYCIGPVKNPIENDFFNYDFANILENPDITIAEGDLVHFKGGETGQCFYFDKACFTSNSLEFTDSNIPGDKEIFILSNIRCTENKRVILRVGGENTRVKVWVNNVLVFNGALFVEDINFYILELSKGDNVVFVQCTRFSTDLSILRFSLRVRDCLYELGGIEGEITKTYLEREMYNKVQVIEQELQIKGSVFEFVVAPRDFTSKPKVDSLVIVVKDGKGHEIDKFHARMEQRIKYNVDKLKGSLGDSRFVNFEIWYELQSGIKDKIVNIIILGDFFEQVERVKRRYEVVSAGCRVDIEDKLVIEYWIKNLELYLTKNPLMAFGPLSFIEAFKSEIEYVLEILAHVQNGLRVNALSMQGGINYVHYKSGLDEQLERCSVLLPPSYSEDKKYPLVIFIPTYRYEPEILLNHSKIGYEDVILAEVSCKGMTLGSYIGEISFFEGLQKIIDSFNIDQDRIYLVGFCGGSHAAWALAQGYPYLFAAMVCISGGQYEKNLQNLSNLRILNICPDKGVKMDEKMRILANTLAKVNSDYEAVMVEDSIDDSISYIQRSRYIIDWLLQHKRVRYPQKIFYRVDRFRHNKTHWVEIVSIEDGKKYCKLEGELIDDSTISLSLINIRQFILTIPDGIYKSRLLVKINESETFDFNDLKGDKIYFEKSGDNYSSVDELSMNTSGNSSLGMGILDIYMNKLKVVIPSAYGSEKEEGVLKSVALAYSNPVTSAVFPEIYADYRIITNSEISMQDIKDYNLILIGAVYKDLFSNINDTLPLKFDESGYEYKGYYKKGDYCIIMICSNPMNISKKVLFIYANNYKLFRNLYTRKVIIPSYSNGIHPFLNSEVILFDGKEYYLINNMGEPMQRLWL